MWLPNIADAWMQGVEVYCGHIYNYCPYDAAFDSNNCITHYFGEGGQNCITYNLDSVFSKCRTEERLKIERDEFLGKIYENNNGVETLLPDPKVQSDRISTSKPNVEHRYDLSMEDVNFFTLQGDITTVRLHTTKHLDCRAYWLSGAHIDNLAFPTQLILRPENSQPRNDVEDFDNENPLRRFDESYDDAARADPLNSQVYKLHEILNGFINENLTLDCF